MIRIYLQKQKKQNVDSWREKKINCPNNGLMSDVGLTSVSQWHILSYRIHLIINESYGTVESDTAELGVKQYIIQFDDPRYSRNITEGGLRQHIITECGLRQHIITEGGLRQHTIKSDESWTRRLK